MTSEELRQLIQQGEERNVFLKRDLYTQWNELIDNILSLVNQTVGTHQNNYLVVGVEKATKQLYDVGDIDTESFTNQLMSYLGNVGVPGVPKIRCELVALEGHRILVITIPPEIQQIVFQHSTTLHNIQKSDSKVDIGSVRDIREAAIAGRDIIQHIYYTSPDVRTSPELTRIIERVEKQPVYEIAMTHNFDLNSLIRACVGILCRKKGLIGFAVPCDSETFLRNFCERLKHAWGRNRVDLKDTVVLKSTHTSIDDALLRIKRLYIPALRRKDVLFAVQVVKDSKMMPFWQRLCRECTGTLEHRLIIVMAVSSDLELSQDIVPLQYPEFDIPDVYEWVRKVVECLHWSEHIIDQCVEIIERECTCDDRLHLELVYIYLETAIEILKQQPTPEDFLKEFNARR